MRPGWSLGLARLLACTALLAWTAPGAPRTLAAEAPPEASGGATANVSSSPSSAARPTTASREDAAARPAPATTQERAVAPAAAERPRRKHSSPAAAPIPASAAGDLLASPPSPLSPPFGSTKETAQALRIVLGLTVLALLPALLVSVTSFLRIIIVLSMLRHAIGMNETPPNIVLTGLALFLTLFTMSPVLQRVDEEAFRPFMRNELSVEAGYERGMAPLREFMLRQTREADLAFMVELSKAQPPRTVDDIGNVQLVPAFMLSELRAAFQIGFVVFLPFLLIDLIVSSVLMSLGMMMMPPTTIALPLKILMFVLVDGWSLLLKALVGSFH
jgi:flagellar biosynthesis protein FliP